MVVSNKRASFPVEFRAQKEGDATRSRRSFNANTIIRHNDWRKKDAEGALKMHANPLEVVMATVEEIQASALKLSDADRAALVGLLVTSLAPDPSIMNPGWTNPSAGIMSWVMGPTPGLQPRTFSKGLEPRSRESGRPSQ